MIGLEYGWQFKAWIHWRKYLCVCLIGFDVEKDYMCNVINLSVSLLLSKDNFSGLQYFQGFNIHTFTLNEYHCVKVETMQVGITETDNPLTHIVIQISLV